MTLEWKNAIRRKRKYAQLYAKNKTTENYELKKEYRNLATKEHRKAIKEFWMKKTDDLKQKPWEFFKTFWPILGKSKGSNTISLETEENSVETNESIISNKFAHYFTNIASTIGGNHVLDLSEEDHKNHTSINAIRKEQLDIDFKFQPITEHDVNEELASISTKKSPGWDSAIPPIIFKEISHAISPSLQSIFNQCVEDCSWPTKWKMGEWTPVFKKGERQLIQNYRPITVLPLIGKIFEHLLCKQITASYDHIMYSKMTAYRKKHSCETALISWVEETSLG